MFILEATRDGATQATGSEGEGRKTSRLNAPLEVEEAVGGCPGAHSLSNRFPYTLGLLHSSQHQREMTRYERKQGEISNTTQFTTPKINDWRYERKKKKKRT